MRLSLWLILIVAFSVGMGCALAIRFFCFDATPVVVQVPEPTTKILFAKQAIPVGVEISADFVVFQEVPLLEVPTGALNSFAQVYRRQPALPIPAGYPIFEDLLLSPTTNTADTAFVPAGSQIVTLDVVQIRQRDKVFLPNEPISTMLAADQRIDIRVVPPEAQGRLAEQKNELLRTYGTQDMRNSGELVLESIPVHRIQRQSGTKATGSNRDSLELILEKNEADRLTAAAKKGQIRILVSQDEKTQPQPIETIALSVPPLPDPLTLAQAMSLDAPFSEHSLSILTESASVVSAEHVQRTAPAPADIVEPVVQPSQTQTLTQLPTMSGEKLVQDIGRQPENRGISAAPELSTGKIDTIRNESMTSFGVVPLRTDTPEQMEHAPVPSGSLLSSDQTDQETVVSFHSNHPVSEVVMGSPRISQTIKFLPPGSAVLEKTRPQKVVPTVMPPIMPSVLPAPTVVQEKVPSYTPFERRIYTVLPENFDKSSGEELQPPQRLPASSDTGQCPINVTTDAFVKPDPI